MFKKKPFHSTTSPERALWLMRHGTADQLEKMRRTNPLKLFKKASERVPAYKQFLADQGVDPRTIKTWDDFQKTAPVMSKANYLRTHELKDVCWDGTLVRPAVFSSTSGSTGKATYFQRSETLELEYSILIEQFLSEGLMPPSSETPTLVIIAFGMGVWIGGVLTFSAYALASKRGYPLSILPAGVNKTEILMGLKELAPKFKQTILVGYPPFIKDILDDAVAEHIDLRSLNIRLMFAAESFTEEYRDYVAQKAGIRDILRDTLNIYRTADIGAMAYETPTAILVRRLALKHKDVFKKIFGNLTKLPTLAQYHPAYMTFETNADGEVLITGDSAMPLIRYAIGDHGGVITYAEIEALFREHGIDLDGEARAAKICLRKLPFVYVYARSDLSTKLYGAIIYPEHIRSALENESLQGYLTGKFSVQTVTDDQHNQFLEVNVELKKMQTASEDLKREVGRRVLDSLLQKNAEYSNNHAHLKERIHPRIVFWPNEDPTHFKPGIKQKWVIRS